MSHHPGPSNIGGGRRPLPPIPQTFDPDTEQHHATLRRAQEGGAGNGTGVRLPEDDGPQGKEWVPTAEDHISRKQKQHMQIPDIFPLRLSEATGNQRDIAATVIADQIASGERDQDGHLRGQRQQQPTAQAPDFDPEVDDENDLFVGTSNATPSTEAMSQQDALREAVRRKQTQQHTQQPQQRRTASASAPVGDRAADIAATRRINAVVRDGRLLDRAELDGVLADIRSRVQAHEAAQ
jgi:hypothetical protein